jgi:hypothetical protein
MVQGMIWAEVMVDMTVARRERLSIKTAKKGGQGNACPPFFGDPRKDDDRE